MLLVHAHPDDETITNGATMAKYAAEGAHVTLVTCTRGEEGEILIPELAHLASSAEDGLGDHRETEQADAMAAIGVRDHRFLGHAGKYRDTGMVYTESGSAGVPPEVRPDTFWRADLLGAATDLVPVIREIRPQVLVTYDEFGGYGHPDHVQAHRVAMYGAALAAAPSFRPDIGPAWAIAKIYWSSMPRSVVERGIEQARKADIDFITPEMVEAVPYFADDALITTRVDAMEYLDAKRAALAAHATQVTLDGPFYALSNLVGREVLGVEYYRLVHGSIGDRDPQTRWESDLFAGVEAT
jgi:N-acetyl-1-D-myo-inositol-2-amino-2-deoxy-alpha-D-glucopyranoside deacetylase